MKIKSIIQSIIFSVLILPLLAFGLQSQVIKIKPKGTYYSEAEGAENPSSVSVSPGDFLMIGVEGEYKRYKFDDEIEDGYNDLNAVFSNQDKYIPYVPVSGITLYPNTISDDVPDFRIAGDKGVCAVVQVPAGADRMLFSTAGGDEEMLSEYQDSDNDFKVRISNLSNIVSDIKVNSLDWLQGAVRYNRFDNLFEDLMNDDENPIHVPQNFTEPSQLVYGKKAVVELVLRKVSNLPVTIDDKFSLSFQFLGERKESDQDSPEKEDRSDELYWQYYGGYNSRHTDPVTHKLPNNARCFRVDDTGKGVLKSNCLFSKSEFDTNGEMRVWIEFNTEDMQEGFNSFTVMLHPHIHTNCLRSVAWHKKLSFLEYDILYATKLYVPKIGIVRMKGKCPGSSTEDCSVDIDSLNDFVKKNETELNYFQVMFPVPENEEIFSKENVTFNVPSKKTEKDISKIAEELFTHLNKESLADKIKEIINQYILFKATNDITSKVAFKKIDVAVAVIKQKLLSPNNPNIVGAVFSNIPHLNRIAFISDDQKNTGTILHELSHVLGQYKDFYQKNDDNRNPLPDNQQDKCTAEELGFYQEFGPQYDSETKTWDTNHTLNKERNCYEFNDKSKKRFRILDTSNSTYKERKTPYSIIFNSKDINEQSIDLSTYRKVYETLQDYPKDPQMIVFSGIYAFDRFFDAKLEYYGFGRLLSSDSYGDIKVILKDKNNVSLGQINTNSSAEIEILKLDGTSETIQSSVVPIFATFPFNPKARKIEVMKDGNVIYSKTLIVDKNPEHLFSGNDSHSTEENFPMLEHNHKVELLKKKAVKATSSTFTKFKYDPGFQMSFSYNACSENPNSEEGIALLLGKDPSDYIKSKLKNGNQGVKFNKKGLSLHLGMKGRIQLIDGGGQALTTKKYKVKMDCDKWIVLKLVIDEDYKLTLTQKEQTLLSYDLTEEQIEEIATWPIGLTAFSKEKGQYGIRHVSITLLEEDTEEE